MRATSAKQLLCYFTLLAIAGGSGPPPSSGTPYSVALRREAVPVMRQGRTVSFKTSYSGMIRLGSPPLSYRVVFDTGSGHVVVPDVKCKTDACKIGKQSYDLNASHTGAPINSKGKVVPPGKKRPNVQIGFGTGGIRGEFVRDWVCVSPDALVSGGSTDDEVTMLQAPALAVEADSDPHAGESEHRGCVEMHLLSAVELSTNPFYYQKYDGILGLALQALAVSANFSFIDQLARSGDIQVSQFGVFLSDGDHNEQSEVTFGGFNDALLKDPLVWNPVVLPQLGYWQVKIFAVRLNGVDLGICAAGDCRGVVDTGSSHLGIPVQHEKAITSALTTDARDFLDCRLATAPALEFELQNMNLTLGPDSYMRRLPIREGVSVGMAAGVTDLAPPSVDNLANGSLDNSTAKFVRPTAVDPDASHKPRNCIPRTLGVDMDAPLGPNFFILGEPVLHKYYAVFDWASPRIGFAVANSKRNNAPHPDADFRGSLPDDVELLLQDLLPENVLEDVSLLMQVGRTHDAHMLLQKLQQFNMVQDDAHVLIQKLHQLNSVADDDHTLLQMTRAFDQFLQDEVSF